MALPHCSAHPVKAWSESSQFRHHSPARINTRPHKDEKPVTLCALHGTSPDVLYIDPTASNRTRQETLLVSLLGVFKRTTIKKHRPDSGLCFSMQQLELGRLKIGASSQCDRPSGCRSTTDSGNQECSQNQSPGLSCHPRAGTPLAHKRKSVRSGRSRA
jgi:hypothetical protein